MFEKLRSSRKENFPSFLYVTSATEPKNEKKKGKSFLVKKKKKNETVKYISECVYKDCSRESEFVLMNYFPYFCL